MREQKRQDPKQLSQEPTDRSTPGTPGNDPAAGTGSDRLGSDDYRNEGPRRNRPDREDGIEPRGGSVKPNSRKGSD